MQQNRRTFLMGAGMVGAMAAMGDVAQAQLRDSSNLAHGMAHGLTLLTMRHQGEYRLGVKTDKGVLDVNAAAELLNMHSPGTMDDLLQHEDGPSLNALVNVAMKSAAAQKAFVKEETIEYGPAVTRPEKIVCVGLNYRKHAEEIGAPVPKQPVLFNKYNVALNHHNGTVKLPVEFAKKFDYEVELVMVMGKLAKNVAE
jgi:2-keto-4-pentenoate hydratase/2-oxohepta-3-ene-1,7-dioic acid hydratase in catechol pathway